jgi:hypothetical protein
MINVPEIQPEMPVVSSNDLQFGVVDHMEGQQSIKLKKDAAGRHHFIPVSWVIRVDTMVHLDRPTEQAMREWRTES